MAAGRWGASVPGLPGAAGRRSRRAGSRTNCAKGVCLAAAAPHPQRPTGYRGGGGEPRASCPSESPGHGGGDRSGVPRRIGSAHASLSGPLLGPARRQSRIEAPGQSKKRAMLGAFDPVSRRLLVHVSPSKRSTDFVDLLDQLGAAYGAAERARPLVAVLDNGPIHRSKLTTKALAERPWLTREWLPEYAPKPNDPGSSPGQAIERCWRDLKQHYLANRTVAEPMLSNARSTMLSPVSTTSDTHSSHVLIQAA